MRWNDIRHVDLDGGVVVALQRGESVVPVPKAPPVLLQRNRYRVVRRSSVAERVLVVTRDGAEAEATFAAEAP